MKSNLNKIIQNFDFAFQPIVNMNTGIVYGYEALLRNYEESGFSDIRSVFDYALQNHLLHKLDLALFEKVLDKFKKINSFENCKLFYNLDNRILEIEDYSYKHIDKLVQSSKIARENICFGISKFHKIEKFSKVREVLNQYKDLGYSVVIDDFGSGFSNLEKLYSLEPDIVKIDRFFLKKIGEDIKKQFFVSNIINLVHTLGGVIVAHGLETKEEVLICRKIGCDLAQGYYIQEPVQDVSQLKIEYRDKIHAEEGNDFFISEDKKTIKDKLNKSEVVYINSSMENLFKILNRNNEIPVIVVLDSNEKPLGIIEEKVIKKYLYQLYGREILAKKTIKELIAPCIVCDVNFEISKIIDTFNVNREIKQLIIVDNSRYIGYLDFISIISIISEKKLINATHENPLTKLPGNNLIHDYIKESLISSLNDYAYVYFDFDNFKAFNDKYGFKKGDEAILLFAEIIRKKSLRSNSFEGHIGGDDFFLGIKYIKNEEYKNVYDKINKIVLEFNNEVIKFYSPADIERGYIRAKDRDDQEKMFPLLTVSASILEIRKENKKGYNLEEISDLIFKLKKTSKMKSVNIAGASLYKKNKKEI